MNPVRTIVVNDGDYLFVVVRRPENQYDLMDPEGLIGGTSRVYRVVGDISPMLELVSSKAAQNNSCEVMKRIEENARVPIETKAV